MAIKKQVKTDPFGIPLPQDLAPFTQQQSIKPPVTEVPKVTTTQPQILRDEQGNITGTDISGKVILGQPKDIINLVNADLQNKLAPAGSVEAKDISTEQAKQEQLAQLEPLVQEVGQVPTKPEEQLTPLNVEQAAKAGVGTAIPAVVGGAIGGATIGALGGPIGAVGGGIIGAVGGFLTSFRGDLKKQLEGQKTAAAQTLPTAQRNLRALISDTNRNPNHAAENLEMFNQQLALIEQKHSRLKRETQRSVNDFVSDDNTADLQRFENFNSAGGAREFYIRQMQEALVNPNPNKVLLTEEDLITE